MKTLEQYFKDNTWPDHALRVQVHGDDRISFYIHPAGVNGDTLDFYVQGNELIPMR